MGVAATSIKLQIKDDFTWIPKPGERTLFYHSFCGAHGSKLSN